MPVQPQITLSPELVAELGIDNLNNAQHLATQSIDGAEWQIFRLKDRLSLMEDGRFAVFIHEKTEGRIVFICVVPGGRATLEDTARIAQLEYSIAANQILPTGVGYSSNPMPTVFIANYRGIGSMASREAVRKGTSASRQLMSNGNFRGLVLYSTERDIVSLMIDVTAKILGPNFQVAQSESDAFSLARQLLARPISKQTVGS